MFNVSALLLDDVLLKCFVTEVVLLSVVTFKTVTVHKEVSWHTWGVVGRIHSDSAITNFLLTLTVKKVWKSNNMWRRRTKNCANFLATLYIMPKH